MVMLYSVGPEKGKHTPEQVRVDPQTDIKYVKQNVIAFTGKFVVECKANEFWGGEKSRPYRSGVLVDPTWGRLYRVAAAAQKRTLDEHHAFFEGAGETDEVRIIAGEQVKVLRLFLGS